MSKYIFKILFSILFVFFSHLLIYAQRIQINSDICIIGTIHIDNPKITGDSIYNLLSEYKPDIILWEVEPNYKPHWCLYMLGYKFKILKVPMEWLALYKIHRFNKSIPILGFDSVDKPRNIFYKNYNKVNDEYISYLDNVKMSKEDSITYESYRTLRSEYFLKSQINSLQEINLDTFYKKMGTLFNLEYPILMLSEKYFKDKKITKEYKEMLDYSYTRNEMMVIRILKIVNENKGSRIAIITGLNHKYFLVEKLGKLNYLTINN